MSERCGRSYLSVATMKFVELGFLKRDIDDSLIIIISDRRLRRADRLPKNIMSLKHCTVHKMSKYSSRVAVKENYPQSKDMRSKSNQYRSYSS
jgi:hypothetical protein